MGKWPCSELYDYHRGQFIIENLPLGNPEHLTKTEQETIDEVLNFYGDKSSQWLSELTHKETPWVEAIAVLNQLWKTLTPDPSPRKGEGRRHML
ncbi:type II toxin-antitoxin system antitoxin SocA domain-containing protein [Planktothricoides raciborskii]|uniref:type II toxin-antitoxin system antitoxin SocA domain-containing protein n=1 Tax=Planktothricoides raciborskii TaxID=132608 RepID=UPI0018EF6B2C|nr:type II toxin-antitoxin system antitoxin SocA domain-containing protein [Planktothricoides raciborskii]